MNRIAADVRRFPAEMLHIYGWLSQTNVLLHWLHSCLMLRKDPITCHVMEIKVLPHATQVANSNMRADSNTRKVSCFSTGLCSSSSDVVDSQFMVDSVGSVSLSSSVSLKVSSS